VGSQTRAHYTRLRPLMFHTTTPLNSSNCKWDNMHIREWFVWYPICILSDKFYTVYDHCCPAMLWDRLSGAQCWACNDKNLWSFWIQFRIKQVAI